MIDIIQLIENGKKKYLKTHVDAVDGLKDAVVSKVGNETVLGTKDFRDGLLLSGRRVLSEDGTKRHQYDSTTTPGTFTSGSVLLSRMGDVIFVNINFQAGADVGRNEKLCENLPASFLPEQDEPIVTTENNLFTIRANGEVRASWGCTKGKYYIGTSSYVAKNRL